MKEWYQRKVLVFLWGWGLFAFDSFWASSCSKVLLAEIKKLEEVPDV